ncbi:MAG TPA: LLM class flavin-dependent oxidoreductase [Tissierellia bacterium]|nr:LLM class flavin-dependent oxidoreductase [Tissierellia bacterium]
MDIKNEIKSYIVRSGYTMTEIVNMINKKYNKNDTVQNLSNKLSRGTIRYSEAKEIAEVIEYKIEWIEKE